MKFPLDFQLSEREFDAEALKILATYPYAEPEAAAIEYAKQRKAQLRDMYPEREGDKPANSAASASSGAAHNGSKCASGDDGSTKAAAKTNLPP